MIYTPETSALILDAMRAIQISNNGWIWIKNDPALIKALQTAGYTIIETAAGVQAYSRAAQEALAAEYKAHGPAGCAVPTYGPVAHKDDAPDYEARILARQERFINY
tara:strand:- start:3434 stop:3754 length:321 start_codon:yes stop_codon:yes gene_type:complete